MKILLFLVALIFLLSLVSAVPQLPMIVSGDVYINGKPAKVGTDITAVVNGEQVSKSEVSEEGKFSLLLQKLEKNQEVEFYVDGIYSEEDILYKSGDFRQISLKVEKTYWIYYVGGGILLIIAGLIWKRKLILKQKK